MPNVSPEAIQEKYGIRPHGYVWEAEDSEGDTYGGATLTPRTPSDIRDQVETEEVTITRLEPLITLQDAISACEQSRLEE